MTQAWLLPLDGSAVALRAVDWTIAAIAELRNAPTVHLLNVQPALPRDISRFVGSDVLREYHAETGRAALAAAEARLAAAGIAHQSHVLVGEAAPVIAEFAGSHHCGRIVIGTHGHGGLASVILGSVATRVVHLATTPVVLVR